MKTRFLPSSQITGWMYNTDVSIKFTIWKVCIRGNQLMFANNRNRVPWVVLCLSQDGACTDSFENFRENSLKGDLSNDITLNPPLFSLVNTFNSGFCNGCIVKRCLYTVTRPYAGFRHPDRMAPESSVWGGENDCFIWSGNMLAQVLKFSGIIPKSVIFQGFTWPSVRGVPCLCWYFTFLHAGRYFRNFPEISLWINERVCVR